MFQAALFVFNFGGRLTFTRILRSSSIFKTLIEEEEKEYFFCEKTTGAKGCYFLAGFLQVSHLLVRGECVRQRNEVAIKLGILLLCYLL